MTRIEERHPAGAVLEQGLDPRQPDAFVALMAAYAATHDDEERSAILATLDRGIPSSDALSAYREATVTGFPVHWRAEEAWIRDVEALALAAQSVSVLASRFPEDLRDCFDALAQQVALVFEPRVWMNPLVASQSQSGTWPDEQPWPKIVSGAQSGLLKPGEAPSEILDAWLGDRLHAEDDAALRDWVRQPGVWHDAYREAIEGLVAKAHVPRLDALRSTFVAKSSEEMAFARVLQDVPWPHLGRGVRRVGCLHNEGTLWALHGADQAAQRLVPAGEILEWADDVLGSLRTEIVESRPNRLELARDAAFGVGRIARGLGHPRRSAIATAVLTDLRSGDLRRGLRSAVEADDEELFENKEPIEWAELALETRLALGMAAHRLSDEAFDEALDEADEDLRTEEDALLIIEDERYTEIVREYDVDPAAWYGIRERIDRLVPEGSLAAALDEARSNRSGREPQSNVVSFQTRQARETSKDYGDADDSEPARAAASARQPGQVALLVSLDRPGRPGRVVRVTVKCRTGGTFAQCRGFAPVAVDAIRDAYEAAASACIEGQPPHLLEDHVVIIDDRDSADIDVIDGSSLGLAFVLAFASAWTNTPVPEGIAATGRLRRENGTWRVYPVRDVRAKAHAWLDAGKRGARILAHAEHAIEIRAGGHEPAAIETIADALREANLDLHKEGLGAAWPDQDSRHDEIRRMTRVVELQKLAEFDSWGDPWRLVGNRLALVTEGCTPTTAEEEQLVERGRILGALAYVHAGDLGAANELLERVAREHPDPAVAVMRGLVELGRLIDKGAWDQCRERGAALHETASRLAANDHAKLFGMVLGTRGRAALHAGDATGAVPLLAQAVRHHELHRGYEVGRSRTYLATALRVAGGVGEALAEVERAQAALRELTKPKSVPYFEECSMFLDYEHARCLLTASRPEAALEVAVAAHAASRHRGLYPRIGILRTLVWACSAAGRDDDAELYLEQLEALGPQTHPVFQRIVAEAEGRMRHDGEVY